MKMMADKDRYEEEGREDWVSILREEFGGEEEIPDSYDREKFAEKILSGPFPATPV